MSFVGSITLDQLAALDITDNSNCVASARAYFIVALMVVVVVVALRIYLRAKNLLWSDIIILLAACFNIASSAVALAATWKGLGQHIWNLGPDIGPGLIPRVEGLLFNLFLFCISYHVSLALAKVSLVLTLVSVFGANDRKFRVFMIGVGAVVAGAGLAATFTTIFSCVPVQAFWQVNLMKSARCIDYVSLTQSLTSITIVTDLIICLVPIPYCWRLRLALRQRIFLSVVFAGGLLACIGGTMRLVTLGIVCASLPRLRPLFSSLGARLTGGGGSGATKSIGSKKSSRGGAWLEMDRTEAATSNSRGGDGGEGGDSGGYYPSRAPAVPRTAGSGLTVMRRDGQYGPGVARKKEGPLADDTVELCEIDLTPGAGAGDPDGRDGGASSFEAEEGTSQRSSEHSPEGGVPGTTLC
ncbi:hypothetical protein GGTG_08760 [Gaeumannomyces tritici R3-111a-1]|uniref:Rhodopsin domain-containing protein n=1 Tax=Gaeumannomyces tritici (strain R3-111a-1) TaxID=644352 RepID=J3P5H1_GAET3|nr:hypothetical protein GGTG_08760 [Gaeumannomyces tritici R3-111a-1]EJT74922.1 hypothetical protein GGTG_08760 [Gaeumannomyces tritici R3-111a-1]